MCANAHIGRGGNGLLDLIDGPDLPRLRVSPNRRIGKAVKGFVIGRVDGDQLALKMGGQLRYLHPVCFGHAQKLVTIIFRNVSVSC